MHTARIELLQQMPIFGGLRAEALAILLDLFPRSASVRAEADCTAIELTPAHLYQLYERDAAQFAMVQMNIAREISRRLRETDDLLFRARMEAETAAGGPAQAPT